MRRLGILSAGGDCPGINAVIRAAAKTALNRSIELIGFSNGYGGLVEQRFISLDRERSSGLLHLGGTILGTDNRHDPFHFPTGEADADGRPITEDRSGDVMETLNRLGIEGLIAIGGDGTLSITREMRKKKGLKAIGVPKTIDNDLPATDQTFGFDTAVETATEALDKLHTTAESHHRVMVLELMGRYAGWIALHSGIAGGADVILIPEIPWKIEHVAKKILDRRAHGDGFSVVVVAEGAYTPDGEQVVHRRVPTSHEQVRLGGIGQVVGKLIEEQTGIETRVTVLGHIQRGGSPSPFDRILATRFGVKAVELAAAGQYDHLVGLRGGEIVAIPFDEVPTGDRNVPRDGAEVAAARAIGISFGDG